MSDPNRACNSDSKVSRSQNEQTCAPQKNEGYDFGDLILIRERLLTLISSSYPSSYASLAISKSVPVEFEPTESRVA